MTKQELISYLDAVCEAENAVLACDDIIALYKSERHYVREPNEPEKPVLQTNVYSPGPTDFKFYFILAAILFVILLFIFGAIFSLLTNDAYWKWDGAFGLVCILAGGLSIGSVCYLHKTSNSDNQKKHESEQVKHNKEAQQNYEAAMEIYNAQFKLHQAALSEYDRIMQDQESRKQKAIERLDTLYAAKILYPAFQTLIAAYQIREYLQMGVCDTLEGPTGAYAQYMNDVRTARICDSITDLKRSLTSAIHGLQGTLARELQQIDSNLSNIRSEMNSSMNRLTSRMQQMQNATAAQLDAHFNEANRQLRTLNENVAIAEHNKYIERRLQNVDTYLMKLPKST